MSARGAFVGRREDLAVLQEALASAANGEGRFVLVTGEAGIGKTALVEELIARARAAGGPPFAVAIARAWHGAGAPSWWLWKEVMRLLGERLVLPPALENEQARFACLETIVERVREIAAMTPLVIALDDLQWADISSLLATQLLTRTIATVPLLLIGTLREPNDSMPASVAESLRREAKTISLGALGRAEVAELVADLGIDERSVDETLRITGGHPLFATRLLEDAEARRALGAGQSPPVPKSVTSMLQAQLEQLEPATRELVEWAAIAGDPLDRALIAAASGIGDDELIRASGRARAAGVFAPADPPRFAHDLWRGAAEHAIPPARRATMHVALARAFENRLGAEARIADHLHAADPESASPEAARASARAARAAITRMAYEQAVVFAERAVSANERGNRAGELTAMLALLAEARTYAGDAAAGAAAAERALAVAPTDDAEAYARAALALGLRRIPGLADKPLVAALEEALARMDRFGQGDLALRCALEARLGAALQPMVDPPRALRLARDAITRARGTGDRELLARTIHAARNAFRMLEPLEERHGLDTELLRLAEALGDANVAALSHGRLFWIEVERGDAIAADLHLAEYERLAARTRIADHEVGAMLARSTRASMCGDTAEATAVLDELDRTRARWSSALTSRSPIDAVTFARVAQADSAAAPELVDEMIAKMPLFIRQVLGVRVDAMFGRHEKARAAYAGVARQALAGEPSLYARTFLAEAAILLDEPAHAELLSSLLAPFAGRHVVGTPLSAYRGSYDRLLAGLAVLTGEHARAAALYDSAIAAEERLGATRFAELTRCERERRLGRSPASVEPSGGHPEVVLVHEGEMWRARFGNEDARVKDSVGMHYLAHLVARPDIPVAAIELFAARAGGGPSSRPASDAGPMLDVRAIADYRARARLLRERLDDATERGDVGAAEPLRNELEQLEDELRSAIGLGGRSRRLGSDSERVRVNVTTRIRKAIDKLRERAPHAAHHLATTIRTGATCVYRTPPRSSKHR